MAAWFNRGKYNVLSSTIDLTGGGTFGVLLLKNTYSFDATDNVVNDLTPGTHEVSGGSYARQPLASRTVTEEDAGSRAYFDAGDPTFPNIPDTQTGINATVIYWESAADDANRHVLFYNDFTAVAGQNSDITIQWHTSGIADLV